MRFLAGLAVGTAAALIVAGGAWIVCHLVDFETEADIIETSSLRKMLDGTWRR